MKKLMLMAPLAVFLILASIFSMGEPWVAWAAPSQASGQAGRRQRPPEPDLIVLQIDWAPGSPAAGDVVHFTADVQNQGDADTSPWSSVGVRLFIDGIKVDDDAVINIPPGETETFDFYWTATSGSHTVRAVADYGDYIPESNEDNNDRQESLTINTPPNMPSNPWPADGATGQSISVDVSWTGGDPDPDDTVTYDVYLEANDSTPDVRRCNDAGSPTCDPGPLAYSTHYYWQVIAVDSHGGSTAGPVWDFTTRAGCQGGWNVDEVDLNGQGDYVAVGAGEAVQVSLDYEVRNPWYGGGAQQIVIGVEDSAQYCAYDGVPATCPSTTHGSDTHTIAAPTQPGTYALLAVNDDQSNCGGAMSHYPGLTKRSIGTIVVEEPAHWTLLVYLDGDNDLESAGIDDFLEMSSVGSSNDVNIVALFDRAPGYASSHGDWTDTRRFHIAPGMAPWGYNGESIGEANMGDPQTLVDFVQWGIANYPADRYAVVLWDHGSGWRLRSPGQPTLKDVAYDETDGGDAIEMPELLSAMDTLSNGGTEPLDLVGFDACLMGMIEVDNQLIPYADVRVGSEETEPVDGWPYDTILSALQGHPSMSASQLGTVVVDEYFASYSDDWTLSAVDLHSPYNTLSTAVDALAGALINGRASHHAEIAIARDSAQAFYFPTYIDLYDFAHRLNQHVNDAAINAAATGVMDAVNGAVIHEQHGIGWPGAHGISIYFPASESGYDGHYDGTTGWLQFTVDTQWDEWLHAFYSSPVPCNDPHEPNDALETATVISYGTKHSGLDICPVSDVDYYSLAGNAGDSIAVDVDAAAIDSALDAVLHLYDDQGTELTHNDDHDGLDPHLEYTLPTDGVYYLRVREYAHPDEGGATHFYTLSLAKREALHAGWATSAPAIDGLIAVGEWDDAATYPITGSKTLAMRKQYEFATSGRSLDPAREVQFSEDPREPKDRLSPVTLYAMSDDTHLYLAIDAPNDTTMNAEDRMGVHFDDNPLPSDGQWTLISCGNPGGEGDFGVVTDTVTYREWIAGPHACAPVVPAPGATGVLGHNSGHAQVELAIDLTSSALQAAPGDTLNAYLWILDHGALSPGGEWPVTADFRDPSTYHPLTLATKPLPARPDLLSPPDEGSTRDTTPLLEWAPVSGAIYYHIQVDDDVGFGSPEIDATAVQPSYTPDGELVEGTTYHWRVRASNAYGDGPWSEVWEFTTSPAEITNPTAYLPLTIRSH